VDEAQVATTTAAASIAPTSHHRAGGTARGRSALSSLIEAPRGIAMTAA
jgi:hypothetical protein